MTDNHGNGNGHSSSPSTAVIDSIAPEGIDAMVDAANRQIASEGMRLDNFISPRTFITSEEIVQRLAGKPKGTNIALGHIAGYVRGFEKRESTLPQKAGETKAPPSIWLRGTFEATVYETGEIRSATWCILPRVMGEAIEDALTDADAALLDIELGVEATGRMIPYAYTVTTFTANRAQAAISSIRMRHQQRMEKRGTAAITGPAAVLSPESTDQAAQTAADRALIRDANERRNARKPK